MLGLAAWKYSAWELNKMPFLVRYKEVRKSCRTFYLRVLLDPEKEIRDLLKHFLSSTHYRRWEVISSKS